MKKASSGISSFNIKGFVGIGWHIGGWKWKKNYLSVAITENGEKDIEIMCSFKLGKTKSVQKAVLEFVQSVIACHNEHLITLAISKAENISLTNTVLHLKNKLNFKYYPLEGDLKRDRTIIEVPLSLLPEWLLKSSKKYLPEYPITKQEHHAIICSLMPLIKIK